MGVLGGRYRALDLTDIKGAMCGKVLALLGVDVIKVEPPAGSSERALAPFYHDEPDPEKSLYWLAYNGNKRGITLNLESADGRDLFLCLVENADFVIESYAPGYLDGLGLGFAALCARNPRVIVTSITPFGQTGPYAQFAADDLTILAAGGLLYQNGDRDRAPLRFAVEQAYAQAGAQAAMASMIAHEWRAISGRGQHVDVSMQEAICPATYLQQQYWDVAQTLQPREGTFHNRGNVLLNMVFPCKDGYVSWRIMLAGYGYMTQALADWMAEEGMAGAVTGVPWDKLDMNTLTQEEVDRYEGAFEHFFRQHTKAELFREAVRRGMVLFPVNDARDLIQDPQLAAREFWTPVGHPALGAELCYPARPYLQSSQRGPEAQSPAPRLGEHNIAIYSVELGLSSDTLVALRQAGVI